jgi:hypothetical protein
LHFPFILLQFMLFFPSSLSPPPLCLFYHLKFVS